MDKTDKIYIAGHTGMVGSAIVRCLKSQGYANLVFKNQGELELRDKNAVKEFFREYSPEYVFLAAAKVGGIQANINEPVEFLIHNVEIQTNIIEQGFLHNVKKILILGSSCIYPAQCPQPMKEEHLLTGPLEPTNEGYALSKIMALKLGEYYKKQYGFSAISVMPPNLYGPNDSFNLEKSHVLSALVRRFVDARDAGLPRVVLWGSGTARREFMHVDDAARSCVYYIDNAPDDPFINIGWGMDISIKELAERIADKTGYCGNIDWDPTKPDGMMRKCMDVTKMKNSGFHPVISLDDGIDQIIKIYRNLKNEGLIR